MPDVYNIIERPIITEKGLAINGERRYAFVVHKDANKPQIREAIEKLFTTPEGQPLTVTAVNTVSIHGKVKRVRVFGRSTAGRTAGYKKAYVTLAEGQSIQIFEGV